MCSNGQGGQAPKEDIVKRSKWPDRGMTLRTRSIISLITEVIVKATIFLVQQLFLFCLCSLSDDKQTMKQFIGKNALGKKFACINIL